MPGVVRTQGQDGATRRLLAATEAAWGAFGASLAGGNAQCHMLERKDRRRWLCAGGAHAVAAAAGWATAAYGQSAPALELGLLPNLSARVLMAQYRPAAVA